MNQQIPVPPSSELRTKLWAPMGFNSEDDPTYVRMRDFVACLIKIHLDIKVPYSKQASSKLELVAQKALNEFPQLGTYDKNWAIKGLIRNSLYNKKRNDGQKNKRARGNRDIEQQRVPLQTREAEIDGPECGRAREGAGTQKPPEAVDSSSSTPSCNDNTYLLLSDPHHITLPVDSSSTQTRTMAWDTVGYESTFNGIASSIGAIASIAHEVGCQQVLHEYSQRQLRTVVVLQPSFDISSTFWILLIFFFCPASFSDEIWDSLIHRVLRYDTSASILPSSLRPWEVLLIWLAQTGHPQALQGLLCPSIAALVGLLQNPNSSLPLPNCIIQSWIGEGLLCCPCPDCRGEYPSTTTASLRVLLLLLQSNHLPSGEDALIENILGTLMSLAQVPMSQIRMAVAQCVEMILSLHFHILSQEQRHTCYSLLCTMTEKENLVYHKQALEQKVSSILVVWKGYDH